MFLDEIKQAYERNPALENLLMDEYFAKKLADHQESWRRVVKQAIDAGEIVAASSCHTLFNQIRLCSRLQSDISSGHEQWEDHRDCPLSHENSLLSCRYAAALQALPRPASALR